MTRRQGRRPRTRRSTRAAQRSGEPESTDTKQITGTAQARGRLRMGAALLALRGPARRLRRQHAPSAGPQSVCREGGAPRRQAHRGDPAGEHHLRRDGGEQADPAAAAVRERCLEPARRHSDQRAWPPGPQRQPQVRVERQCRHRLELLRQADARARSSTTARCITLDAAGTVTAVSASGGNVAWRASTTPPNEKDQEGFGGGLAADDGRVFAATGFGQVVAFDAKGGKKLWEKSVGSPLRASPTAAGGRVFAVTKEGQVFCLSASDGTELWTFQGQSERASILVNTSPAVDGDIVVVPYPTGDVVALRASSGQPVWSESLARTRTASSLGAMSDAARPAVAGGVVFAVGHAGRMVATSLKTGERAVVADRRQHPAAVGGGRHRVRGRYRRPGDGRHAQRRQNPVGQPAAGWRHLVRAGACRQPAVAHLQQGAAASAWRPATAGWRARRTSGRRSSSPPWWPAAAMYRAERQRPADGLQLNFE